MQLILFFGFRFNFALRTSTISTHIYFHYCTMFVIYLKGTLFRFSCSVESKVIEVSSIEKNNSEFFRRL